MITILTRRALRGFFFLVGIVCVLVRINRIFAELSVDAEDRVSLKVISVIIGILDGLPRRPNPSLSAGNCLSPQFVADTLKELEHVVDVFDAAPGDSVAGDVRDVHIVRTTDVVEECLDFLAGIASGLANFKQLDAILREEDLAHFEVDLVVAEHVKTLEPDTHATVLEDVVNEGEQPRFINHHCAKSS